MSSASLATSARSIWDRRSLLKHMALSQLRTQRRNLILGYLWWILNPLLWTLVYWILVVAIFGRGEPNYPLFLLSALLPWRFFTVAVGQSGVSVASRGTLLSRAVFPRPVLPLSVVLAGTSDLVAGLGVLVLVSFWYGVAPSWNLLYLPVVAGIEILFTVGCALWLSALAVFVPDLNRFRVFVMRVWFYMSPALYGLERVPEEYRDVFMLNPFAPILIGYRTVLMEAGSPITSWLGIAFAVAVVVTVTGFAFFVHNENRMVKRVA